MIGVVIYINFKETYASGTGISYPTGYKTLGTQYGNPLFSPCINKRCAGGPYMYTNNPYLQAACNSISPYEMDKTTYGPGLKPAEFDYSVLSNGAWSNTLCNTQNQASLCAL